MGFYRGRVFFKQLATVGLVLVVALNVCAKDFGNVGHTYKIMEQDLIEYIKSKLKSIDFDALKGDMQETVKKNVQRPKPVLGITKAKEYRSWYYDPTYTLKKDLKDHNGTVIHRKGYTVNPLQKTPLPKLLIFVDGDDEEQVNFALEKSSQIPVKIILTKGSPLDLQKKHKIWIYFDQHGGYLTTKLGIRHVPAVVSQEGLQLKIQEIKLTNERNDQ